jgi:hypothetical protein
MQSSSRPTLEIFVEWLLDNLFDIATILLAGYLVVRYQVVQPKELGD